MHDYDRILKKIEFDFNLLDEKFKKNAVKLALNHPKEVTPLLMKLLQPATQKPGNMDISYNGHVYANTSCTPKC